MADIDDRTAVLASLAVVKERQDKERRDRIRLMRRARDLGIPNARIGVALGVTETAVRSMLKRAPAQSGDD